MSKKDIILSFLLSIFIISLAICIIVFFKPLYYFDIHYLDLPYQTGLSYDVIKDNYDALIQYQSIFYQGSLQLPNFHMSVDGRIHFEEVKKIFEVIQIICVVSGISSGIMVYQNHLQKEYRYLKVTAVLCILIPIILGLLVSIDFNKAFILFHKIIFRNDFWMFSELYDPVIIILPERYFMHCFMMILIVIIGLSYSLLKVYKIQEKKIVNTVNFE